MAAAKDGVEDCVEGARRPSVVLKYAGDEARPHDHRQLRRPDFLFDGLKADSGVYAIEVSHPEFAGRLASEFYLPHPEARRARRR